MGEGGGGGRHANSVVDCGGGEQENSTLDLGDGLVNSASVGKSL